MVGFLFLLLFVIILIGGFKLFKNTSKKLTITEYIWICFYILFLILFFTGLSMNSAEYTESIDPIDGDGYTPFSNDHSGWLIVFFFLSLISQISIWQKGKLLPPILFVCGMSFMWLGVFISTSVFLQVMSYEGTPNILLCVLPIFYIITTASLTIKIIQEEAVLSSERIYSNSFLNKINTFMSKAHLQPLWIMLLIIPLFLIIMCILTLFGQDPHALTKVFTDTSMWTFSQKEHPPFLDHRGHYLCTVAACGNPELVKPVRLGKRNGHEIIVNRQLQIANAFEELIEQNFSKLHRIIRHFYDKYGYPLSKKITTPLYANLTYRLMKPLEYFFLIVLYSFCTKPEEKIKRQYASHN